MALPLALAEDGRWLSGERSGAVATVAQLVVAIIGWLERRSCFASGEWMWRLGGVLDRLSDTTTAGPARAYTLLRLQVVWAV